MKKRILEFFLIFFAVSGIFAKDLIFTKKVSMKETDKIEFVNCTRHSDIKGYVSSSTDKAVGFYLKQTGDKYTASIGDWKNLDSSIAIILYDIDFAVDLRIHTDKDDLYIAIVEPIKE